MYRIPEIVKKYTDYDMIIRHTDLPEFPEFRTRLLLAFLSPMQEEGSKEELYAIAASLVQLGLDTHEMVDAEGRIGKKEMLTRQLRVLAGDYFSSRFYQLLSQAGHIDVVKSLSAAICDVNRHKMNLYLLMKQLKMTGEEYIRYAVDIKSSLFLAFAGKMEGMYRRLWPEVLQGFTRCEVLLQELFRSESPQQYRESWAFWHVLQQATKDEQSIISRDDPDAHKLRSLNLKYNVRSQLLHMLDEQWKAIQKLVGEFGSESVWSEMSAIGEPFARYMAAPKVLEEI